MNLVLMQKNKKIITTSKNFLKSYYVLPQESKAFFNYTFDKGRLKSLVSWTLENYGQYKTVELLEQLKKIGFEYATKAGISLGIDDLKIPPKKQTLLLSAEKLTKLTQYQYERADITAVERFQRLIETWHRTSEQLKQEVINHFEETDVLNPVYMMAFSGARGNISQVRQLVGMRGLMSNPQGQIIDFPIRSNFREGLTLTEYIISSYGARKGIVDTALRTANAGYLTRRLVDVAQHVIISHFDCGTQKGIFLTDIKENNKTIVSVQNRIVGRVLARDIYKSKSEHALSKKSTFFKDSSHKVIGSTYFKVFSRNQEISSDIAFEIAKLTNKIFVRSPLTCNTTKMLCQLCYGWSLAQGNLVSVGEAVGVIAAQSIGEPGTQLTMRTFHTGGVFSGDVSDEIRAPYNGYVYYENTIPGILIRAIDGKILFLTKSDGTLFFSKVFNTQVLKTKDFHNLPDIKKYKIPAYTILFMRNGEEVFPKQVVAQITSIRTKSKMRDTAELIIKSDFEGIFYGKNLIIKKQIIGPKPKYVGQAKQTLLIDPKAMEIVIKARGWNFGWVLSGKRYELPLLLKSFPICGDYITQQTMITRHNLKLPCNTSNQYVTFNTLKFNRDKKYLSDSALQNRVNQKTNQNYKPDTTLACMSFSPKILSKKILNSLNTFKNLKTNKEYFNTFLRDLKKIKKTGLLKVLIRLKPKKVLQAKSQKSDSLLKRQNMIVTYQEDTYHLNKQNLLQNDSKENLIKPVKSKSTQFLVAKQKQIQSKNKLWTFVKQYFITKKEFNTSLDSKLKNIFNFILSKPFKAEKKLPNFMPTLNTFSTKNTSINTASRSFKKSFSSLVLTKKPSYNAQVFKTWYQNIKIKQDLLFLNLQKIKYHKLSYFYFFNCDDLINNKFTYNLSFADTLVENKQPPFKKSQCYKIKFNLKSKKTIFHYNIAYKEIMLSNYISVSNQFYNPLASVFVKKHTTKETVLLKRFKMSNNLLEWFSSSTKPTTFPKMKIRKQHSLIMKAKPSKALFIKTITENNSLKHKASFLGANLPTWSPKQTKEMFDFLDATASDLASHNLDLEQEPPLNTETTATTPAKFTKNQFVKSIFSKKTTLKYQPSNHVSNLLFDSDSALVVLTLYKTRSPKIRHYFKKFSISNNNLNAFIKPTKDKKLEKYKKLYKKITSKKTNPAITKRKIYYKHQTNLQNNIYHMFVTKNKKLINDNTTSRKGDKVTVLKAHNQKKALQKYNNTFFAHKADLKQNHLIGLDKSKSNKLQTTKALVKPSYLKNLTKKPACFIMTKKYKLIIESRKNSYTSMLSKNFLTKAALNNNFDFNYVLTQSYIPKIKINPTTTPKFLKKSQIEQKQSLKKQKSSPVKRILSFGSNACLDHTNKKVLPFLSSYQPLFKKEVSADFRITTLPHNYKSRFNFFRYFKLTKKQPGKSLILKHFKQTNHSYSKNVLQKQNSQNKNNNAVHINTRIYKYLAKTKPYCFILFKNKIHYSLSELLFKSKNYIEFNKLKFNQLNNIFKKKYKKQYNRSKTLKQVKSIGNKKSLYSFVSRPKLINQLVTNSYFRTIVNTNVNKLPQRSGSLFNNHYKLTYNTIFYLYFSYILNLSAILPIENLMIANTSFYNTKKNLIDLYSFLSEQKISKKINLLKHLKFLKASKICISESFVVASYNYLTKNHLVDDYKFINNKCINNNVSCALLSKASLQSIKTTENKKSQLINKKQVFSNTKFRKSLIKHVVYILVKKVSPKKSTQNTAQANLLISHHPQQQYLITLPQMLKLLLISSINKKFFLLKQSTENKMLQIMLASITPNIVFNFKVKKIKHIIKTEFFKNKLYWIKNKKPRFLPHYFEHLSRGPWPLFIKKLPEQIKQKQYFLFSDFVNLMQLKIDFNKIQQGSKVPSLPSNQLYLNIKKIQKLYNKLSLKDRQLIKKNTQGLKLFNLNIIKKILTDLSFDAIASDSALQNLDATKKQNNILLPNPANATLDTSPTRDAFLKQNLKSFFNKLQPGTLSQVLSRKQSHFLKWQQRLGCDVMINILNRSQRHSNLQISSLSKIPLIQNQNILGVNTYKKFLKISCKNFDCKKTNLLNPTYLFYIKINKIKNPLINHLPKQKKDLCLFPKTPNFALVINNSNKKPVHMLDNYTETLSTKSILSHINNYFTKKRISYIKPPFFDLYSKELSCDVVTSQPCYFFPHPKKGFSNFTQQGWNPVFTPDLIKSGVNTDIIKLHYSKNLKKKISFIPKQPCINIYFSTKITEKINPPGLIHKRKAEFKNSYSFLKNNQKDPSLGFAHSSQTHLNNFSFIYDQTNLLTQTNYFSPFEGELLNVKPYKNYLVLNPYYGNFKNLTKTKTKEQKIRKAMFNYYLSTINNVSYNLLSALDKMFITNHYFNNNYNFNVKNQEALLGFAKSKTQAMQVVTTKQKSNKSKNLIMLASNKSYNDFSQHLLPYNTDIIKYITQSTKQSLKDSQQIQKDWSRFNLDASASDFARQNLVLTKKDLIALNTSPFTNCFTLEQAFMIKKNYQILQSRIKQDTSLKNLPLNDDFNLDGGLLFTTTKGFQNKKTSYLINKLCESHIKNTFKIKTLVELNKETHFNKAYNFNLKNKWIQSLNLIPFDSIKTPRFCKAESNKYFSSRCFTSDALASRSKLLFASLEPGLPKSSRQKTTSFQALKNFKLSLNLINSLWFRKQNKQKQKTESTSLPHNAIKIKISLKSSILLQSSANKTKELIYYRPYFSQVNIKWNKYNQKKLLTKNKVGFFFLKGNPFLKTTSTKVMLQHNLSKFNNMFLNSKMYNIITNHRLNNVDLFNDLLQDIRYSNLKHCVEIQKLHINQNFLILNPWLDKLCFNKFKMSDVKHLDKKYLSDSALLLQRQNLDENTINKKQLQLSKNKMLFANYLNSKDVYSNKHDLIKVYPNNIRGQYLKMKLFKKGTRTLPIITFSSYCLLSYLVCKDYKKTTNRDAIASDSSILLELKDQNNKASKSDLTHRDRLDSIFKNDNQGNQIQSAASESNFLKIKYQKLFDLLKPIDLGQNNSISVLNKQFSTYKKLQQGFFIYILTSKFIYNKSHSLDSSEITVLPQSQKIDSASLKNTLRINKIWVKKYDSFSMILRSDACRSDAFYLADKIKVKSVLKSNKKITKHKIYFNTNILAWFDFGLNLCLYYLTYFLQLDLLEEFKNLHDSAKQNLMRKHHELQNTIIQFYPSTKKTEKNKYKTKTSIMSGKILWQNYNIILYNPLKSINVRVIKRSGQLIHMNKQKITIRIGQPLVISPNSIIHASHGDFIPSKTSVINLTYQQLKTGDIVQGIPKIEQLFEARTTKRGRLFKDNVSNLLTGLFLKYFIKTTYLFRKNLLKFSKNNTKKALENFGFDKDSKIKATKANTQLNVTNKLYKNYETIILSLALEWSVKQSFYKIQQIIVDGILRVYRSQGVSIADKHVEIIVKQMTSKVRIINSNKTKLTDYSFTLKTINSYFGKKTKRNKVFENTLLEQLLSNNLKSPTGLFPGEIVDLDFVENINTLITKSQQPIYNENQDNIKQHSDLFNNKDTLQPIKYEPIVLGITRASLEVESFLSAASFQQTTRVLSQAALYKKKDFLKGLKENIIIGNLIPAGTGYISHLNF
uniref:DNA-directed RNA polymerase n=1 Tax=Pandorina colemaniae TaxID=47786 RepID=A0A6C0RWK3_9CHLO|nr:beta' subunit of RNA polymerase [Pandorina colemaniae]